MIIRRVIPYLVLGALCASLYSYSRDTRQDIKVEYGHHNMDEPYVVDLDVYENRYICNDCDMMVMGYKSASQVVTKSGKVYLFDDIGCMINWVEEQGLKEEDYQAYVYVNDTKAFIKAEYAWYIRDGSTPVGYGFVAYELSISASASAYNTSEVESQIGTFKRKEEEAELYEYDQIRELCIRGETLLHPMIKHELLIRN